MIITELKVTNLETFLTDSGMDISLIERLRSVSFLNLSVFSVLQRVLLFKACSRDGARNRLVAFVGTNGYSSRYRAFNSVGCALCA